jgi:hypothetical protein
MSLAWITSYPKSGNTWARVMLASYLHDDQVRLSQTGWGAMHEGVPDLVSMFVRGRMLPVADGRPLAVKTHFLPGSDVLVPYRTATRKVLYIVRNPRDVILSAERFMQVSPKHRTAFARHFIDNRGAAFWQSLGYGTWPQHVREWTSPERLGRHFPNAEVCVVRYEDMRRDPAGALHEMIAFLGFDAEVDPERVERAVRNSTLDKLRQDEQSDQSRKPDNNPFFGTGLTDQSLAGYGDDVEQAYRRLLIDDEEFASCAVQFGYAK